MGTEDFSTEISEREQQILRYLIDQYIRDGQPVGSRTLSKMSGVSLSPATLRNVMCDLEQMGLLISPHTSAGRIPTTQGYRLFIDRMLEVQPMQDAEVDDIRRMLDKSKSETELIHAASSYLSNFTQMAGVVTVPKRNAQILQQIDFLPLSNRRLLVVLVINDDEVQNRIIQVDRDYSKEELDKATKFINQTFTGQPLAQIHEYIRKELLSSRDEMTSQLKKMVEMVSPLFEQSDDSSDAENMVVDGQTNLMGCTDLSDMETLRVLFDAFNQKRDIYHLLERCISAEGVQVFIGQESGYSVFDECSLVSSSYKINGEMVGVLGVVGPTRMAYDRVVPIVDITSKLLSAALNS